MPHVWMKNWAPLLLLTFLIQIHAACTETWGCTQYRFIIYCYEQNDMNLTIKTFSYLYLIIHEQLILQYNQLKGFWSYVSGLHIMHPEWKCCRKSSFWENAISKFWQSFFHSCFHKRPVLVMLYMARSSLHGRMAWLKWSLTARTTDSSCWASRCDSQISETGQSSLINAMLPIGVYQCVMNRFEKLLFLFCFLF